jgi:hypothetical protein
VSQHMFRRVNAQANRLRNGEMYHDLLDGELIRTALKEEKIQYRVRKYPPLVTLWTFLTQVLDQDQSCRMAVARLIAFLVSQGQTPVSPDTSNYCKARRRLPISLIVRLVRKLGEILDSQASPAWSWKGRDVYLVDGSTASMPDTPKNQRAYPQPGSQKPGLGFPVARFVTIISLATGGVLDLALGPCKGKGSGETGLLRTLLKRLKAGAILLGDRYFASYFALAELHQRKVDGTFRMHQRRKVDFARGRCLGCTDHIVVWKKPARPEWMSEAKYAQMSDEISVRELKYRVSQPGYRVREIILVTTLLDPAIYTKEDLADLYLKRWNVELDLRSIKIVMQMDVLRCKSPDLVDKEIWIHMLGYNIIRGLMATAAGKCGAVPRELSFKATLQALTAFRDLIRAAALQTGAALWEAMFAVITYDRVGDRPGRFEPRAKKRRPKQYDLLTIPRPEARNHLAGAA